jgi:hypothetical protein
MQVCSGGHARPPGCYLPIAVLVYPMEPIEFTGGAWIFVELAIVLTAVTALVLGAIDFRYFPGCVAILGAVALPSPFSACGSSNTSPFHAAASRGRL